MRQREKLKSWRKQQCQRPVGESRAAHRNGNINLNRENDVHATPKTDKFSMHAPQNKRSRSFDSQWER